MTKKLGAKENKKVQNKHCLGNPSGFPHSRNFGLAVFFSYVNYSYLRRYVREKRDVPMTSGQLLNLPTRAISSKLRNCPNFRKLGTGKQRNQHNDPLTKPAGRKNREQEKESQIPAL